MEKLVIFGAGKIVRSFIGPLFSRSGYEVVFVDINKPLIEELNRRRCYNVIIKSENEEKLVITNVRGILAADLETIANEVTEARILAVSVGIKDLRNVLTSVCGFDEISDNDLILTIEKHL